jgi:hypothetical protein
MGEVVSLHQLAETVKQHNKEAWLVLKKLDWVEDEKRMSSQTWGFAATSALTITAAVMTDLPLLAVAGLAFAFASFYSWRQRRKGPNLVPARDEEEAWKPEPPPSQPELEAQANQIRVELERHERVLRSPSVPG